jgi:fructosamine-3-kinase
MRTQLLEALQNDFCELQGCKCKTLEPVGSASTWRAELSDGRSLFLKLASPAMLKVEARGLRSLQQWADRTFLLIPDPLGIIQVGELAALILPWLDTGRGDQYDLGRGLARLHRTSADAGIDRFGWDEEGFIGLGPQPSGWLTAWGDAFVTLRLIPQLQLATNWGLDLDELEPLLAATRVWLDQHQPLPCLVHGDLWGGNASVLADGRGALIDPACWWADREVDLAMTCLFGGFSSRFYEGYQKEWPLDSNYEGRIDVYNLYHLLNHANLFGGGYQKQCLTAINAMRSMLL